MKSKIRTDYQDWLVDLTCKWCSKHGDYSDLMTYLYSRKFTFSILNDENRASDGMEYRFRFIEQDKESRYTYRDVYLYLTHPCNVLEMMAALSTRCEEHIMGDPSDTDKTYVWFWGMIKSMHLGRYKNGNFDEDAVETIVSNMLDRNYKKNGDGGLFTIKDSTKDMRYAEIWCQLSWFLSELD